MHPFHGGFFVRPEIGPVVGVVAHQSASLLGQPAGGQGGGAGGLGGEAHRAEMHHPGQRGQGPGHLLLGQQGVGAGAPVEGKGPLAGGGHADHRLGGEGLVGPVQTGDLYAAAFQNGLKIVAVGVGAHLADEAGARAEPGSRHGHVGGSPAGIGGVMTDAAFVDMRLGEVNEQLAHRKNCRHESSSDH